MQSLKAAAHTLGCKVNKCDTDTILSKLRNIGFDIVSFNEEANLYIINTCTVTHVSDKKSRQMIRRGRKLNQNAFVAVCGCMAANDPVLPIQIGADFVFDSRKNEVFFAKLHEIFPLTNNQAKLSINDTSPVSTSRTRAFVKVQDGCDRFCSYCIIPYVRGSLKSRDFNEILDEVKFNVKNGFKEIVLTGIQVASYGHDTKISNLPKLLKHTANVNDLKRLRLSSIDPWAIDDEFLQVLKEEENICSHFHLSLQSGSNKTLKAMNRRYTTHEYKFAAQKIKNIRSNVALTTDIIVGFPGETDEDFNESLSFVREVQFADVHVFEYSVREGTKAAAFPNQVSPAIKAERNKQMRELSSELKTNFLKAQVGKTIDVLFEKQNSGHSDNYCIVETDTNENPINTIKKVKIIGNTTQLLKGKLI